MSIPSKARAEWIANRVNDAYASAEAGQGWTEVGRKWGMSKSGALMWCRDHLPAEVFHKIGRNGLRQASPNKGNVYHYSKPKVEPKPPSRSIAPNQFCQYVWLDAGKLQRCLQPTKGHTYCADCLSAEGSKHLGSRFHSVRSNGKWSHVA